MLIDLSLVKREDTWASQVTQWVKNLTSMQATEEMQVPPLGWEVPLEEAWQPTSVFLPGESHGQMNLAGYST